MTESHNNGIGAEDDLYYTYDAKGQLTQFQAVIGDFNLLMDYDYDEVGNKISVEDPANGTTSYQYDALDRVNIIINPYDETTTFEYDSMNRVTNMTYANGIILTNTYDDCGCEGGRLKQQVYEIGETTLLDISYTYNSMGRLETRVDNEETTTYTYDDDDRLTDISYPWDDEVHYEHDNVGNRVEMVVNEGDPITYQYNADNQLLEISDGSSYTYDNNGNVIIKTIGGDTIYSYDYENRLVGVVFPDETTADYIYDSLGKRLANE